MLQELVFAHGGKVDPETGMPIMGETIGIAA